MCYDLIWAFKKGVASGRWGMGYGMGELLHQKNGGGGGGVLVFG